jgi:hypothetical protein
MELLQVTLRLVHIVTSTLWVGFGVFMPIYLAPALEDAGPEAGKVIAALQRRGILTLLPSLALASILSGAWLYWRVSGGLTRLYLTSPTGLAFAVSGLMALAAYLLGILVTRPAMTQAMAIMQSLSPGISAQEHHRLMATAQRLRERGGRAGRVGAGLLLLSAAGMAVARYL